MNFHRCRSLQLLTSCLLQAVFVFLVFQQTCHAAPDSSKTAKELDRLLSMGAEEGISKSESSKSNASLCDDATFLRRTSLDSVGDLPTPEKLTSFVLDPSDDKREQLVDEYLAKPQFGQNWARYWRDVILYRRMEDRALLVSNSLVVHLTEELNKGTPWDEVARGFITAKGDVREDGRTAIIAAQDGKSEETTAEIARIFLGMQIQCSQCHDDFSGRWQREEFHELAAFFPRIAVRPVRSATKRSLLVAADDNARSGKRKNNNGRRGKPEHYMSDLDNPTARGTLMTPKFFLTGSTLELGTKDSDRRGTLARWITEDQWFAKSQVNRIWTELVGEGFYDEIDDLGPDRDCENPEALELLATKFAESNYDMKWLFKTIMLTSAYQSAQQAHGTSSDRVTSQSQRLRADQLYNCVTSALETPGQSTNRRGGRAQPYGGQRGPRGAFNQTFGYDPSNPRDEVTGSIPQALALMNSPQINSQINGRNRTMMLGKLIRQTDDPTEITQELYLRVLSREPRPEELTKCVSYIRRREDKIEGYEDVLWALLNSAELLHRN